MKNKNVLVIVILLLIILVLVSYILYDNFTNTSETTSNAITNNVNTTSNTIENITNNIDTINNQEPNLQDLYGTYSWEQTLESDTVEAVTLKCVLVLNPDGTATYQTSDSMVFESTKGTYKYEDNKIVYTKEYLNYEGQEPTVYDDSATKTEVFSVVDKDSLQNTYHDNQITLVKSEN